MSSLWSQSLSRSRVQQQLLTVRSSNSKCGRCMRTHYHLFRPGADQLLDAKVSLRMERDANMFRILCGAQTVRTERRVIVHMWPKGPSCERCTHASSAIGGRDRPRLRRVCPKMAVSWGNVDRPKRSKLTLPQMRTFDGCPNLPTLGRSQHWFRVGACLTKFDGICTQTRPTWGDSHVRSMPPSEMILTPELKLSNVAHSARNGCLPVRRALSLPAVFWRSG